MSFSIANLVDLDDVEDIEFDQDTTDVDRDVDDWG